ncbi:MAG: hypothetical protein ABI091_26705 [Ferruginibacter sp.]
MGCNCGKGNYNRQQTTPTLQGNNQAILKQIELQQQQQSIKRVIEQSNNPSKTLIKTYR